jgi:hypothetical protein
MAYWPVAGKASANIEPARAIRTEHGIVACGQDGTRTAIVSRFVIDASGRSSAFGGGRKLTGVPALALFAYFRGVEAEGSFRFSARGFAAPRFLVRETIAFSSRENFALLHFSLAFDARSRDHRVCPRPL